MVNTSGYLLSIIIPTYNNAELITATLASIHQSITDDVEVIIENKSIENEEFVGVLRKNQNLKEILTNIKNFGIIKNFEIHDKKVVLQ